jgi:hypothetical protein
VTALWPHFFHGVLLASVDINRLGSIWDFACMKKPELVLFGRYIPMAGTKSTCIVCSHMRRNCWRHFYWIDWEAEVKVVSGVRWLVVGCALAFKKFEILANWCRKGTLYSAHRCNELCWRVIGQDFELKSRRIQPAIKLFEGMFIAKVSTLAGSSWKKVGLYIDPYLLAC